MYAHALLAAYTITREHDVRPRMEERSNVEFRSMDEVDAFPIARARTEQFPGLN